MKWTSDQQLAINHRGSDILLSAAAGSGKTTVMVERIFEIVKSGCDIESLLVITFTRAAAGDMKRKLVNRFSEALDDAVIVEALDGVERANICTIDSYCSFVLRQHFEAAGVDPGYRILTEAEEKQLQARAIDEALSKSIEQPDEDMVAFCFGREMIKIKEIVKGLYEFSRARPDPEGFLDMALETMPSGDCEIWFSALLRAAKGCVLEALARIRKAVELCRRADGPQVYLPSVERDEADLEHMLSLNYEELRQALGAFRLSKIMPLRSNDNDECNETRLQLGERVKELRKAAKTSLEQALETLPEKASAIDDMRLSQGSLRALRRLCRDYGEALWALKSERMALSFNDVAQLALKVLGDDDIAQYQKDRFQYVFVDEYQDVSDLQEAIISRVAQPGKLFMVGDVKQSIYSFRQAEPSLFIGKYRLFTNGGDGELIALSSNFRSRGAIIDFVNGVFIQAMNSPMSEMPYDGDALLVRGLDFYGVDTPVELHILDKSQAADDYTEAEMVAEIVKGLIGQDFYPGSERKIRAGDIAVIARTRETLRLCDQALTRASVKSYVDVAEGYLEAVEVRIMLSVMRAIENRRRDFPLIETLRSPIVGLTSTQLAEIRARFPEGAFCEAFNGYIELGDELADKLRHVKRDFDRWRFLSRHIPLCQWIDLVMNETGFYAYVGALPSGRTRQANLDLLCNYASDYSATQEGGLTGFLDYITQVENLGGDMSSAHASSDIGDCVVLMTVHKAKGLEFPVVVAAGLGRGLSGGRHASELRLDRTLGAGIYYNDALLGTRRDTLCRRAITSLRNAAALEEEKRVLYVMLTRAAERLILTGSVQTRETWEFKRSCPELTSIRPASFLDMVSCCVPNERIFFHEPANDEYIPFEQSPDAVSDDMVESARRALMWEYPYEGSAWLPVKLTVTSLARELTGAMEGAPIVRQPRFLSDDSSGASHGTLIHTALSAIDLEALKGLEGSELEGRIAENLSLLLKKRVLNSPVEPWLLARFFRRDIGHRLLSSPLIRREWQFNLKMTVAEALGVDSPSEIIVQGMIDCCFMEDDKWVLIDYKTDAFRGEPNEEYVSQVRLYKLALERITGIPVKQALLCFIGSGVEVEV